jgi:ATP-binding cassette subfamily D (ALD) protein 2
LVHFPIGCMIKMDTLKETYNVTRVWWDKLTTGQKLLVGSAVSAGAMAIAFVNTKSAPKKDETKGEKKESGKFMKELKPLLNIAIPSYSSKEFFILVAHTASLAVKTFFSLYIAYLDGTIVQSLILRDVKTFFKRIGIWLLVAIPASYTTSIIKYAESKLASAFRTRLSTYAYDKYMKNETYYRVVQLDGRLANVDQCLTEDIKEFSETLAHVWSQISKPTLDLVLNIWQIIQISMRQGKGTGLPALIAAYVVIQITSKLLRMMRPPFGKMVEKQASLEGRLRSIHSRLIQNSEEIAFYRGHEIEKTILDSSYNSLAKHLNDMYRSKIMYTMAEQYLMKYVWNAAGLVLMSVPTFYYEQGQHKEVENVTAEEIGQRSQDYVHLKNLMVFGAEAIERIMLASKDIAQLAGYTTRVSDMVRVFDSVEKGEYTKQPVELAAKKGTRLVGNYIKFEDVPLITPNGETLIESISFEVRQGQHCFICGANGTGKTALFRLLGDLWPIHGGTLTKPPLRDLFYVPQKSYLVAGTFRDQVIYPDTVEDMQQKGRDDAFLMAILDKVNMVHVCKRHGMDRVLEWKDVLSGGEKQRIGMARLFYHQPKFAILDECTSAVSMDVEGKMFQYAIDVGITLLTVAHRPSTMKYHNHLLQFDGEGKVVHSKLTEVHKSLKEEKENLEEQLENLPQMRKRLQELCTLLGEDSIALTK